MKRRDFLQQTAATTALVSLGGLGLQSFTSNTTKKITILHTNDVIAILMPLAQKMEEMLIKVELLEEQV